MTTTGKAQRKQEVILDTALGLFASQGYQATTMREIASAAGTSTGLTYRYFRRKDDLALALYSRLADQLHDVATTIDGRTVAERFTALLHHKLTLLEPHRSVLLAVIARAFEPSDDLGVLGPRSSAVRDRVMDAIRTVTRDANEQRVRRLYTLHLLVVLLWTQDRTPDRKVARGFVDLLGDALPILLPLLPLAGPFTKRFDRLMKTLLMAQEK